MKLRLTHLATLTRYAVAACLVGNSLPAAAPNWNPALAGVYLDQRASWWAHWPAAARDRGTVCLSCHTAVPYLLARPALRAAFGQKLVPEPEVRLIDSVRTRVRQWKNVDPYYNAQDGLNKTAQARGTEAVLNAFVILGRGTQREGLTEDGRLALGDMWSVQIATGKSAGAWEWLQFGNEPFEAHDSQFYGAALGAVTVGMTPESYRSNPEVRKRLGLLQTYLTAEMPKASLINRAVLLWASVKWEGLIRPDVQEVIEKDVFQSQRSDGGWNLASLAWTWKDWNAFSIGKMFLRSYGTPISGKSDGYATAFLTFVLEQTGLRRGNPSLNRALTWLVRNQNNLAGYWPSYSLNNRRDPSSPTGKFMSDAASAYAVLALLGAQ
jgi:squalene-hopene/tetraprenyl-beta-curcumene cyclase